MRFANRTAMGAAVATEASGAIAAGAFALMSSASASPDHPAATAGAHAMSGHTAYSFRTVDNAAGLTFNQLLGINNAGVIAGYFGSGAQGHPNMGYLLTPAGYTSENFPGSVQTQMSYQLQPVETGPAGTSYGTPQGWATVAYDPNARTITVTLTASGLTPGAHAAHIHIGSCVSQGPVQYMLMDFTANGQGRINHEVRTVTGVTTPVPATGWYLKLHQGNSNNILANGQPTPNFRPLLCAGL
jgi:hypothetical protein